MTLDEIVSWYQKKIGTYDKQQWEKTVEQKILDGFGNVSLKTAKLKTELIDVDLVRGSTFPKAKPKQSLVTVIRLAILRYIFLPLYAQWWVAQTSLNIFGLLLLLYITQMLNWAVYTYNLNRSDIKNGNSSLCSNSVPSYSVNNNDTRDDTTTYLSDLLIPMALSFLLSLIHSQIVATNAANSAKAKRRRRYSNANSNYSSEKHSREHKLRRRRRLVKIRNQESVDTTLQQQRKFSNLQPKITQSTSLGEISQKSNKASDNRTESTDTILKGYNKSINPIIESSANLEVFISTSAITKIPYHYTDSINSRTYTKKTFDLRENQSNVKIPISESAPADLVKVQKNTYNDCCDQNYANNEDINSSFVLRKRNVNWQFPSHTINKKSCENFDFSATDEGPFKIEGVVSNSVSNKSGSTSSSSSSINKILPNDVRKQDIYEDDAHSGNMLNEKEKTVNVIKPKRNAADDDGFESLNGKSSSGEETNSPLTTRTVNCVNIQLRNGLSTKEYDKTDEDYHKNERPAYLMSDESDEVDDDGTIIFSNPNTVGNNSNECTTSTAEWLGVTTNSEECSYSSELEQSDHIQNSPYTDEDNYDFDFTPNTILNAHGSSDRISCTIWDNCEIKKAQMSVLEISSSIIERVESMQETNDYIYIGIVFSVLLSLIPAFCRLCEITLDSDGATEISYLAVPMLLWEKASFSIFTLFRFAFGQTHSERIVISIGFVQRLCLTMILFIIFAVAERTFKQRFLYAKLFSHLTSSRRARKSNLPHFRLNKVRNIKTWLSVRSYLKKRGPQRSVDVIVSAAFIVTLLLLAFLSVEWLKDSGHLHSHCNLEALMWSSAIGIFLIRFMTLGNKTHDKYRSISVLITEQINLYLQIEQKPKKKEELMVANSVLKLASDLLKELETPFKISGLSANPYLFTTTKVVILSALSGVLSEMLGFKLKLHKIKIK